MKWNHYAFGGEVLLDPETSERWIKMVIMDRRTGVARSGPISVAEIEELIDNLSAMRRLAVTGKALPAPSKESL